MAKHAFLKLYWVYALMAIPEVIEALRAADTRGTEVWPVMLHREDRPSEVVSQIVVPTVAGPALAEEDKRQPEPCATCGVTKYAYHQRGMMHLDGSALRDDVDLQLTHEWFGSDTKTGRREFLVSNRIARLILEHGWTGAVLWPVELV